MLSSLQWQNIQKSHCHSGFSASFFIPFAVPTWPVVVSRPNFPAIEAIYDQGQLSLRRLQQNPFYPIADVTLEADYSGYRLTQPLKKTVLSSTAIKFPIKVDNVKKCFFFSPFFLAQSAIVLKK